MMDLSLYQTSTDYALLYDMLCNGLCVIGLVDRDGVDPSRGLKDVCLIRRDAAWQITASGRGISYVSIYPWSQEPWANPSGFDEPAMLAADCKAANLSFVVGVNERKE